MSNGRAQPREAGAARPTEPGTAALQNVTISVRHLRLRTFIGFKPEEREKRQDVVINLDVDYRPGAGVATDEVADALDYKKLTKQVIRLVEGGRFLLLEKLAADILGICADHDAVRRARVTVDKPHALRFADSVAVSLEHRTETNDE